MCYFHEVLWTKLVFKNRWNQGTLQNESYTVTFYVYGILAKLCLCFKYDKILIYTKKLFIPTRRSLSKRREWLWNDLSKTSGKGGISSSIISYEFSYIWNSCNHLELYTSSTIVKGIAVSGLRNSIQRMISSELRCGQCQWDSLCFRTSLSC